MKPTYWYVKFKDWLLCLAFDLLFDHLLKVKLVETEPAVGKDGSLWRAHKVSGYRICWIPVTQKFFYKVSGHIGAFVFK